MKDADRRARYAALKSHDPRFDGRWFVGVTSTGIYCRPVCPAKVPKFENCTFHEHAAAAEKAGFRPCLMCRPELAPGDAKVDALSRLARFALRRIEDGALNHGSVESLAGEYGVTARHLRRALNQELGVTPIELAQTQRLLHAKQLLTETDLSITDAAFGAGFDSLRRFNDLFKARYGLSPRALRKHYVNANPASDKEMGLLSFRIDYRPPFAWQTMLDFLAARAIPGVELVTEGAYVRTVRIGEHRGWLRVRPVGGKAKGVRHALNLSISENLQPVATTVIGRIKALFDTRADAAEITDHLGRDPVLATIVKKVPGMRLPGAFDGFELLLRAIIGQQISVAGATTVAGRAAQRFGEVIQTPWPELNRTNPTADRLARARVGSIAQLGMPGKRASSIKLAATRVASEELRLVPGADPEIVRALLTSIPGIGDWTAAYVAMRGLGWPDALPAADLGIKKALGLTKVKDVEARTETWRPWRAYGAIYCWLSLSGG